MDDERRTKLRAASQAAARSRTRAKHRRWAQEMRAAGWAVAERQTYWNTEDPWDTPAGEEVEELMPALSTADLLHVKRLVDRRCGVR